MTLSISLPPTSISIHASARETTNLFAVFFILPVFQSTPPRGRRQSFSHRIMVFFHFNPRLREGDDFAPTGVIRLERYFNPRLREGDDTIAVLVSGIVAISIHASARETTKSLLSHYRYCNISIHASARETTALITNFYI